MKNTVLQCQHSDRHHQRPAECWRTA